MINGSFVFGLDGDDRDVFLHTVDWSVSHGITTTTFHILALYPGTALFREMERRGRIVARNGDLYDTRHVVCRTASLRAAELEEGYSRAYREFYSWPNIVSASRIHDSFKHQLRHFFYTGGWEKFEPLWNFIIKTGGLNPMLPLLESILSEVEPRSASPAATQITRPTEYII